MARMKLTDKGVRALKTDRAQEDFWDTLTPGLHLRVSGRTGRKTWFVRYRAEGTHRRMKLGTYHEDANPELGILGLADARKRAREALAVADAGEDPALQRVEEGQDEDTSFQGMAREALTKLARKGRGGKPTRRSTQRERERMLERELLPHWQGREAGSITRREVLHLVEGIAERGAPVQANRTLALIRVLYNQALKRDFPGVEFNPAHMIDPPGVEEARDRYLKWEEFPVVWKTTEEENPLTRGAFRLTLFTAQRIGSVLAMRWDGITEDGSGYVWRIPEEHFKGRRPHLVPLSPEAMTVVNEIREVQTSDEWVFPSREDARRPHLSNMNGALARIRRRSGLDHWTLHDFRTTFRTWATRSKSAKPHPGLGAPGHVADAILGHKEASLGFDRYTGSKTRYLLAEKREALVVWGQFIRKVVKG